MTARSHTPRFRIRQTLSTGLLAAVMVTGWVPVAAAAEPAEPDATVAVPEAAVDDHASFDPAPDLQRTPGGNLIVNAFIMQGPVRVEVRERGSDRVLLEREADALFPFELSHRELGVEPERVEVHIYVDGALAHQLMLREP